MELYKIEQLLEKYFQGETSIAEEKELANYFSSVNVAHHLEQYQPLFGYFLAAKEQKNEQKTPKLPSRNIQKQKIVWWSLAASIIVLLGIGTYVYTGSEPTTNQLGTFNTPEEAFAATQEALALVSGHVNTGIKSVQVIQEYDTSKEKIFNH